MKDVNSFLERNMHLLIMHFTYLLTNNRIELLDGTVPANKLLLARTVLDNEFLLACLPYQCSVVPFLDA